VNECLPWPPREARTRAARSSCTRNSRRPCRRLPGAHRGPSRVRARAACTVAAPVRKPTTVGTTAIGECSRPQSECAAEPRRRAVLSAIPTSKRSYEPNSAIIELDRACPFDAMQTPFHAGACAGAREGRRSAPLERDRRNRAQDVPLGDTGESVRSATGAPCGARSGWRAPCSRSMECHAHEGAADSDVRAGTTLRSRTTRRRRIARQTGRVEVHIDVPGRS
jgi:hypothetical protein